MDKLKHPLLWLGIGVVLGYIAYRPLDRIPGLNSLPKLR